MRFFAVATSILIALPAISAQLAGFDPSLVPTACLQNQCQSLVNAITKNNCVDLNCLCTNDIASGMKSCFQCVVNANIAGYNQTVADQTISSFADGCAAAGHPISGASSGGSPSVGTTSGSGTAAPASPPATSQKASGAAVEHSLSILGSLFAVAMAGAALL